MYLQTQGFCTDNLGADFDVQNTLEGMEEKWRGNQKV